MKALELVTVIWLDGPGYNGYCCAEPGERIRLPVEMAETFIKNGAAKYPAKAGKQKKEVSDA